MTEDEWLTCGEPAAMWRFGRDWMAQRKGRLFGVRCCTLIRELLTDYLYEGVLLVERLADESGTTQPLEPYNRVASDGYVLVHSDPTIVAVPAAHEAADISPEGAAAVARLTELEYTSNQFWGVSSWCYSAIECRYGSTRANAEKLAQAHLLRDIFGNPFRPIAFSREWRTSTAVALAQQMYDSRDFGLMPIVGDALQDAGCDSDVILDHCRGPGPHVRGCWVVDLVLGKE